MSAETVPCLGGVTSSSTGIYHVEHCPFAWMWYLTAEPTLVSVSGGTLRRIVVSGARDCPQTWPALIAVTINGRSK
jgi:hypothetical protein